DSFERRAYVPEAPRGLLTVGQAQQRGAPLRRVRRPNGHRLITNRAPPPPKWAAPATALAGVRHPSYSQAGGAFDRYSVARRAWIGAIDRRGDRLELQVDAQTLTKFERSYKIVREPMRLTPTGEKAHDIVVARWTAVGAGDEVVATGRAQEVEGDRLVVD